MKLYVIKTNSTKKGIKELLLPLFSKGYCLGALGRIKTWKAVVEKEKEITEKNGECYSFNHWNYITVGENSECDAVLGIKTGDEHPEGYELVTLEEFFKLNE